MKEHDISLSVMQLLHVAFVNSLSRTEMFATVTAPIGAGADQRQEQAGRDRLERLCKLFCHHITSVRVLFRKVEKSDRNWSNIFNEHLRH
jgi:hypothetical protein